MDILEIIDKYNLSIRKFPSSVTEVNEIQHKKEGDEEFTITKEGAEKRYCRREKIPTHAGWYMCKQLNDTYSMVRWDIKKDHLAPTLEESINLFLKEIKSI